MKLDYLILCVICRMVSFSFRTWIYFCFWNKYAYEVNFSFSVLQDFSEIVIFRNDWFAENSCSQWKILPLFGCCYSFLSCRRAVIHLWLCWGTDCSSSRATDTDNASQSRGWGHLSILKSLLLAFKLLVVFLLLPFNFFFYITHFGRWRTRSPSVLLQLEYTFKMHGNLLKILIIWDG